MKNLTQKLNNIERWLNEKIVAIGLLFAVMWLLFGIVAGALKKEHSDWWVTVALSDLMFIGIGGVLLCVLISVFFGIRNGIIGNKRNSL